MIDFKKVKSFLNSNGFCFYPYMGVVEESDRGVICDKKGNVLALLCKDGRIAFDSVKNDQVKRLKDLVTGEEVG